MSKNERQEVLRALDAWDRSVFREVTSHQSPLLDRALPALTTAADRSVIWLVVAAGLAATGRRRQRRAAVRGVSSVAVTSLLVNQLAKRVVPRPRPVTPRYAKSATTAPGAKVAIVSFRPCGVRRSVRGRCHY